MLSDTDLRYFAIQLLKAETARDQQRTIGASNLSNGCDYCLAANFTGDMRETPMLDRVWGGRVLGTSIHGILEQRLQEAKSYNGLDELGRRAMSAQLAEIGKTHPDLLTEFHMILGEIPGYGAVGSTTDCVLPSEKQGIDWKGTDDAKLAIIIDYLAISRGEEAPYGRLHRVHKKKPLSEKVYAQKLIDAEFKISGYYNQLQEYGLGLNNAGIEITTLSIVFISRDNTMYFDNPTLDRYDDPKASHGVFVLSFPYNEEYALAVWQRGLDIWAALQAGAKPSDFPSHESCFPCGLDREQAAKEVPAAA